MRRVIGIIILFGLGLIVMACAKEEPETSVLELPEGRAGIGASLFNQSINDAASCSSCHALSSARGAGPGMANYGDRAGNVVDGESAEEYTYWAILRPGRHLVSGYSNVMPSNYEDALSDQQLADLIAYLLTL